MGQDGRAASSKTRKEAALFREAKSTVLGMVERGGRVKLRVITSRRGEPLSGAVRANVNPEAILFTDDWMAYKPLAREFAGHRVINHSAGVYVEGDIHTNTIEGFFGNLKTGMRGTYKYVSQKWLQSYLDEYAWRYNHRRRASARCSTPSSTRRRTSERETTILREHPAAPPSAASEADAAKRAGDRRSARLLREAQQGGRLDHSDRFGGRSFPSGRLRPAGGATFRIAASNSPLVGTGISSPLSVFCLRRSSATRTG